MTDDEQLDRFGEAVEQKNRAAEEASKAPHGDNPSVAEIRGDQPVNAHERPQDVRSPRDKNTAKDKVTADKWNQ